MPIWCGFVQRRVAALIERLHWRQDSTQLGLSKYQCTVFWRPLSMLSLGRQPHSRCTLLESMA